MPKKKVTKKKIPKIDWENVKTNELDQCRIDIEKMLKKEYPLIDFAIGIADHKSCMSFVRTENIRNAWYMHKCVEQHIERKQRMKHLKRGAEGWGEVQNGHVF